MLVRGQNMSASHSRLARSTLLSKTETADPPERGAFSPYRSAVTDSNPYVLETFQTYRVRGEAVNPMQSQDFHLFSTVGELPSKN